MEEQPDSLLTLMHPDGVTRRSVVLGSACPEMLCPPFSSPAADQADLVILAPSAAECRVAGWLEAAVQRLGKLLAPDGVAYILVPIWCRWRLGRLLQRQGLKIETHFVHVPRIAWGNRLVPLAPSIMRYAVRSLLPTSVWKQRVALAAVELPWSTAMMDVTLPSVALVARQSGARPLFLWAFQQRNAAPGGAIISTSWRGLAGPVVLHLFAEGEQLPSLVGKLNLTNTPATSREKEAAILLALGPAARQAGAVIPEPMLQHIGGKPVLLLARVGGQSASTLLATQPIMLTTVADLVTTWLERWHKSTAQIELVDDTLLDHWLIGPAASVARGLEGGQEYLAWLQALSLQVRGLYVPLVACHNDLVMSNVFVDNQNTIAVIDWEMASPRGLPLTDLVYALTDIAMMAAGGKDRVTAFQACFAPGGHLHPFTDRLRSRLAARMALPPPVDDLCFHACWLHHATNEQRYGKSTDGLPYHQIVQYLAATSTASWTAMEM